MLVSRNSRLYVCILKLNLLDFEVFLWFHLIAQCSLALCNEKKLSAFQGERIKFRGSINMVTLVN